MTVDRNRLQGIYSRLRGLRNALPLKDTAESIIGEDFDKLTREIGEITGEDVSSFILPSQAYFQAATFRPSVHTSIVKERLAQLLELSNKLIVSTQPLLRSVLYITL
jgi:hypothetical protein